MHHLATMFLFDKIPVIVSGAIFESRPAPAFNYLLDENISIKTQWVNKEGFYWVRMDVDEQREAVWVNFIRADIDEVSCSILIYQNISITDSATFVILLFSYFDESNSKLCYFDESRFIIFGLCIFVKEYKPTQ